MTSKSLTLKKLSECETVHFLHCSSKDDDLLTDHLIDKVYFWTTTHKSNRRNYHSSRSIKTDAIVALLKQHVIPPKAQLRDALHEFFRLGVVRPFYNNLDSQEKRDFKKYLSCSQYSVAQEHRHVKRYLNIYRWDAGFEIGSTDRYRGIKSESCILALKAWKPGEIIHFLTGTIVSMTGMSPSLRDIAQS